MEDPDWTVERVVTGEFVLSRAPAFQGGDFMIDEIFENIAEARAYVEAVISGQLDPFIADAWYQIAVIRRRVNGRFTKPAWLVVVTCRRPRAGEQYEIRPPQPWLPNLLEVGP